MAPLFAIDPWKLDNKQLSDESSHTGDHLSKFSPSQHVELEACESLFPFIFSLYLKIIYAIDCVLLNIA